MNRYLIYFSYIGTRFKGVQKQYDKGVPLFKNETIQSLLESALLQLKRKPLNIPVVYPASRTDQGVHALCTAAHVDLEFYNGQKPIYHIIHAMNKFFKVENHDIRVLNVQLVPDTFSARYSAIRKTYLYRFAVVKPDALPHVPYKSTVFPTPIIEKDRCYFIQNPKFDISLAKEAANLFIGKKDFRAFMGKSLNPEIVTQRSIEELTLTETSSLLPSTESKYYDFWQVTCRGKSFLYRQVRRTVGVLIAVAQKKISIPEVEAMFENPTKDSWNDKVAVVPPYGLYLQHVDYREEDLLCDVEIKKEIDIRSI